MAGRFTFSVLLVSSLVQALPLAAQDGSLPFDSGPPPAWGPSDGFVSAASMSDPAGSIAPNPYFYGDPNCPPGAYAGQARHGGLGGSWLHTLKRTWIRAEWLQWTIEDPGRDLLGAPLAGVPDPRNIFPVFDFQVPPQPLAAAFVPDLQPISFPDTNGARVTIGVPFEFGQFEASGFALEEAEDSFTRLPTAPVSTNIALPGVFPPDTIPPFPPFDDDFVQVVPAVTLLQNGRPSNVVLLYNGGLNVSYASQIWGTEAVFVGNSFPFELAAPERGLTMKPIVGFRYTDIDEQLNHVGTFIDPLALAPPLVSTIRSDTDNDLYGAILGFRAEFEHRWFTLGAEPRVTLGANDYTASVTTHQLRGFFDPRITTTEEDTIFSPVLDFQAYARLHLHENFSVHVGYNVLWFGRITRPHENIVYNDPGTQARPPGVVVDAEIEELMLEGLSLGGEFRFK